MLCSLYKEKSVYTLLYKVVREPETLGSEMTQ